MVVAVQNAAGAYLAGRGLYQGVDVVAFIACKPLDPD